LPAERTIQLELSRHVEREANYKEKWMLGLDRQATFIPED
jgi:hypothetical protein